MDQVIKQSEWHHVIRTWATRLSDNTRRQYEWALDRLGQYLKAGNEMEGEYGVERTMAFLFSCGAPKASALLAEWADAMRAEGLAPKSVRALVSVPMSLFRLAESLGAVGWVPLAPRISRESREDRRGPSKNDLVKLIQCLEAATDPLAKRDLAAVRLMASAGLRRAEVASLTMGQIDLNSDPPALLVRRKAKQELERVTIGTKTAESLVRWVSDHARGKIVTDENGNDRGDPQKLAPLRLFPVGESLRRMLRRRAKQAGIKSPVRPHGLRHRGASEVAAAGFAALMAFGGWQCSDSALHYLDDHEANRQQALAMTEF